MRERARRANATRRRARPARPGRARSSRRSSASSGCSSSTRLSAARARRADRPTALEGPSDAGRVEDGIRARHVVQCRATTDGPVSWGDAPVAPRGRPDRPRRRRPRRQRGADPRRVRAGRRRGLRPRRVPRARDHRATRPRTCCCGRPSSPRRPRRSRRSPRAPGGSRRSSASPRPAATSTTRPRCCAHGKVQGVYRKHLLPNYAVFDEQRYFAPSTVDGPLFVVGGVRVGVTICEDAWSPIGPILTQAAGGAELIVNINASPYYAGRIRERETMLATRAADAQVPDRVREPRRRPGRARLRRRVAWCSTRAAALVARAKQFAEDLLVVDLDVRAGVPPAAAGSREAGRARRRCPRRRSARPASVRRTTQPRVEPTPRPGARGLRGARARHPRLRPQERVRPTCSSGSRAASTRRSSPRSRPTRSAPSRVTGVLMPSRYSSEGSVTDAEQLAAEPRHRDHHGPDRAGARGVHRPARADVRGHHARTWPRRTSRPASAARC